MTDKNRAKLVASWSRKAESRAKTLFDVMLDEGLCGQDYDDQIDGALAAGIVAGRAQDVDAAFAGAEAYRDGNLGSWLGRAE